MLFRPLRWCGPLLAITLALVLLAWEAVGPRAVDDEPGFDQPDTAAQYDIERRRPVTGSLDMPALYDLAAARVARLDRFASRINRSVPFAQAATRVWIGDGRMSPASDRGIASGVLDAWTPLGPGNIGGRTRVVRFHPTVPTTLFAAGVSGGVWTSEDDGASWRPTGEGLTNIAINSLAIDPREPDTMFAGTGEGYFREEIRGTGLPLRGGGVFVSRNRGVSWQRLPATATPDFYWVNDLELGVADPRRLYAATRTGVWRSSDRGGTWTRLLETTVRGGCLDLALRPDRAEDVLFASCGSYAQATVYRFSRASDRADVEVVLETEHMGRTSLAIAPSNPDVMYALSASNDGGPGGNYRQGLQAVYRSARGGDAGSWETRTTNRDPTRLNTLLLTNSYGAVQGDCSPGQTNSYTNMGWYNNVIAVDPRDPDRVWAAGVDWFRSDDGGRNWGMASWTVSGTPGYAHVDQHGIAFHPSYDGAANQTVMIGNDGGVFRSNDARGPTASGPLAPCTALSAGTIRLAWTSLNHGYGVTQFYHGTPLPDGVRYLAGAQDNGTVFGSDGAGPDGWRTIGGGDGGFTAVNPNDSRTIYFQSQWAALRRSNDTGATSIGFTSGLDPVRSDTLGPDANYLFVAPLTIDAATPQRLWTGGEYLYRSPAGTQIWGRAGAAAVPDGGVISAIAVSPRSSEHVVAGTHKGDIVRTRNALAGSSVPLQSVRPRDGWVTAIAFDPRAEGVVYATYGNFGGAHVYRSADHGETWRSIDGTGAGALPDIPVHSIVVDPDDGQRLYVGTDLGVMVSIDGGQRWMTEETGFGPAVTMWLSLLRDPSGQKLLFAFTHGRGAWRVRLL